MASETELSHGAGTNFDERAKCGFVPPFKDGLRRMESAHKDRVGIVLMLCVRSVDPFHTDTGTHASLKACMVQMVYNFLIMHLVWCTGVKIMVPSTSVARIRAGKKRIRTAGTH